MAHSWITTDTTGRGWCPILSKTARVAIIQKAHYRKRLSAQPAITFGGKMAARHLATSPDKLWAPRNTPKCCRRLLEVFVPWLHHVLKEQCQRRSTSQGQSYTRCYLKNCKKRVRLLAEHSQRHGPILGTHSTLISHRWVEDSCLSFRKWQGSLRSSIFAFSVRSFQKNLFV